MKVATSNLVEIGGRMKAAREALGLSQKQFCELYGYQLRTIQKNEAGINEAGICLTDAFIRAGINANWLLTGDGPMLLADLRQAPSKPVLAYSSDSAGENLLAAEPSAIASQNSLHDPALRPSVHSDRSVRAETLPCRKTYLDCTGNLRDFELTQNFSASGTHVIAAEITSERIGYRFEAWAAEPSEAISRLNSKIKEGLARRYTADHPDRGLQLLSGNLAGVVESGGLVIDGRFVTWEWLEREIQTHEGLWVEIQFKDASE